MIFLIILVFRISERIQDYCVFNGCIANKGHTSMTSEASACVANADGRKPNPACDAVRSSMRLPLNSVIKDVIGVCHGVQSLFERRVKYSRESNGA